MRIGRVRLGATLFRLDGRRLGHAGPSTTGPRAKGVLGSDGPDAGILPVPGPDGGRCLHNDEALGHGLGS